MGDKRVTRSGAQDERVSLHGLDPEDALRALLAVRPEVRDDSENRGGSSDDTESPGARAGLEPQ